MGSALEILQELGSFNLVEMPIGGGSIDSHGVPLTEEVLTECRRADAILLGAVGGPKWDTVDAGATRAEDGLMRLRSELGLFANLRPVRPHPALIDASPLRPERVRGTDLMIVRELTGGLYFGPRGRDNGRVFDTCVYTEAEIERVLRVAFKLARRAVASVDKSNVLETSRAWREVAVRIQRSEFPETPLEHLLVDNAAMQLLARPSDFDVIVTENLFGDILSDEAAMITGSIGLLPSASLGENDGPGLFEPVHGSAPDIAGLGRANPLGMLMSVALMLRLALDLEDEAEALEQAIFQSVDGGIRTPDLGGTATTRDVTDAVLAHV
jgi:3-isopropylmalate dehydrogenase